MSYQFNTAVYDMSSQPHELPDEIICKILSFSSPIDVVRARLVSKRIRNITYDHEVWKALYANARLPRPPGPFPCQSTQVLERILVPSARLAESWTTRPMEVVATSETRLGLLQRASPKLVCGRWIVSCEQHTMIVSHDPTRNSLRRVIWYAEPGATILFWESCSITSVEGESIYIVTFGKPTFDFLSQSRLLEFRVNGDSLEFCSSLDIPAGAFNSSTGILVDDGPFLYIQGLRIVFDTRTRIFYGFPEFSTRLSGIQAPDRNPHHVLLTSTHVITLNYSVVGGLRNSVLVQAFTPPHLTPAGMGDLQLTHESIGIPESMSLMTLLRDSTVDSVSGCTNVRFMCRYSEAQRMGFRCVDFTFPEPRENSVLPITFDIHDIASIPGPFSSSDDRFNVHLYIDASWDGHVRGYIRFGDFVDDGLNREFCRFIIKFTIDASEERCQAVFGEASMQDQRNEFSKPVIPAYFDGVRGRVCYGTGPIDGVHGYDRVHVVEIR